LGYLTISVAWLSYIASNVKMIVIDELEMMWKDVVTF
jgi:hypothetical protein